MAPAKSDDLAGLIVALQARQIDCTWYDPVADVLSTEYIANRYPGLVSQPPAVAALRGFILDTGKLFEELSGRDYVGPPLPLGTLAEGPTEPTG
jgi:hypothetical protein